MKHVLALKKMLLRAVSLCKPYNHKNKSTTMSKHIHLQGGFEFYKMVGDKKFGLKLMSLYLSFIVSSQYKLIMYVVFTPESPIEAWGQYHHTWETSDRVTWVEFYELMKSNCEYLLVPVYLSMLYSCAHSSYSSIRSKLKLQFKDN